ncbi:Ada metal-binding domain-containing protein [Flavobacterium noncentrifugens]|uniref:Metal binding domain of Ada n=1 Tax=Flavobacterium noncentrifugens TaxID=1128970 RepID=A0A1G8VHK9_9FLAO|nr:Ada metal-binding domain-containing protein [Flavobacterium noncentrifugens]SDJ65387.1 Metal binding domain of Ada [Flavobacterium noncentrifugens]
MINHFNTNDAAIRKLIKEKKIAFAGNKKLKIYGTFRCDSGKRMKRENRIFFASENDAIANNFRPCGHCMKLNYQNWKNGFVRE